MFRFPCSLDIDSRFIDGPLERNMFLESPRALVHYCLLRNVHIGTWEQNFLIFYVTILRYSEFRKELMVMEHCKVFSYLNTDNCTIFCIYYFVLVFWRKWKHVLAKSQGRHWSDR